MRKIKGPCKTCATQCILLQNRARQKVTA